MFAISFVSAAACDLDVALLNQDPIRAVPGEYVNLVFQVQGIENPECKDVTFRLVQEYPFSLDPGVNPEKTITAGTFTSGYNSQATIPFDVRVDSNALNKNYEITTRYSTSQGGSTIELEKKFNVSVENVKADFDVFVDDYQTATNTLTLNILNIGKNDVEALIVEVPKQDTIQVKGSSKAIVGTLDSNQDTTFSYEATPKDGTFTITIQYNDENGERRSVEKTVLYDSSYFTGRSGEIKSSSPVWKWIVMLAVLFFLGRLVKKKFWPKKEVKHHVR